PANGRIERRDMKADGAGVLRCRSRAPLPGIEHRRLVMLLDPAIAGFARVVSGFGLALVPAQPLELEPLHLAAMRARHEVPALVRSLVFALDPRQAMDGRRRAEQHLRAPRERARA